MKYILIVDDDVDILEMLAEFLVLKGFKVIPCNKSVNVMEKVSKYKPQLIISDIQMPLVTGRDLVFALKSFDENIPIIILSGKANMKNDVEFALSKNVKAFLSKPCDLNKLLEEVRKVIPAEISTDIFLKREYGKAFGSIIGNCKIDRLIGVGGTGIVYHAMHNHLKIPVAVKILSPNFDKAKDVVKRFLREASSLASINHPNIVQILNADHQNNIHFIIMKYIEGESFLKIINRRKKIDYKEAGKITIDIAKGLSAAHKNSILHRDVKPSNVLISKKGEVQIVDFGIACDAREEGEEITEEGIILGTPGYMSPEQCMDEELDERTDVYSLGVTFYRAIIGKVPFEGTGMSKLMSQLRGEFKPAHVVEPSVPIEISLIISKMIAKDKKDRYPDMDTVISELRYFLERK